MHAAAARCPRRCSQADLEHSNCRRGRGRGSGAAEKLGRIGVKAKGSNPSRSLEQLVDHFETKFGYSFFEETAEKRRKLQLPEWSGCKLRKAPLWVMIPIAKDAIHLKKDCGHKIKRGKNWLARVSLGDRKNRQGEKQPILSCQACISNSRMVCR